MEVFCDVSRFIRSKLIKSSRFITSNLIEALISYVNTINKVQQSHNLVCSVTGRPRYMMLSLLRSISEQFKIGHKSTLAVQKYLYFGNFQNNN